MDERTPVEFIAADIAPELDRAINNFLARPGGDTESDRRRDELKAVLWNNKVGLLRVAQAYGELTADLRETFKALLFHCGPSVTNKVTTHVMAARRARETNTEIDALEKAFSLSPHDGKS